jgi:hypothetical protein
VDLEGDHPDTNLVIVFHQRHRPQCRYAWRYRLWAEGTLDPEPVGVGEPHDIWLPFLEWLDTRFAPSELPCNPESVAANPADRSGSL